MNEALRRARVFPMEALQKSWASRLIRRVSNLFGSGYVRAVAALSGGQLFATALPLFAAPILGRLYLPEHYGVLGTYMAVSGVLGVVSTLQLQQGVFAEKSDRRAEGLVQLCFLASAGTAMIVTILAFGLFIWMGGVPAYADVRVWVLMLPFSTLTAGANAAVLALANRHQRYGAMARLPMYSVAVTVATSIGLGLLGWGAHGLLASYFLGQSIGFVMVVRLYRRMAGTSARLNWRQFAALGWRHRTFPLYTLPSLCVGAINQQLPVYALTAVGAVSLLGLFTRARQLVSMPITLLGGSIAQVFHQRAAQQYRETGSCRPIYRQTALVLAAFSLPPLVIFMLLAPDMFLLFLGPNWAEAGEVARVLAPMLLLRFISAPLATVLFFTGAQWLDLALTLFGTILCAICIIVPLYLTRDSFMVVMGFSVAYSVMYTLYLLCSYGHTGQQANKSGALKGSKR